MRRLAGSVSSSSELGVLCAEYIVGEDMPEYMNDGCSLQR